MTPVQLSQNVLRQLQVTGWANLAAVYDRVAKTATENQIVSAKNDNRVLLSKTVLRLVWDRDRKRALLLCHKNNEIYVTITKITEMMRNWAVGLVGLLSYCDMQICVHYSKNFDKIIFELWVHKLSLKWVLIFCCHGQWALWDLCVCCQCPYMWCYLKGSSNIWPMLPTGQFKYLAGAISKYGRSLKAFQR